ncbi:S-type anion channel [Arachis hypogaea]|nr:S-type anion channel [Arachis hypogaea]
MAKELENKAKEAFLDDDFVLAADYYFPPIFFILWSLALFVLILLSLLYILRCLFFSKMVKAEFLHHVGVNYLFVPWISWLLLLESSPFMTPKIVPYLVLVLWRLFVVPLVML